MGAVETADLLESAAEHLREASDCTGLEIEGINGHVLLQGAVSDLEAIITAVSESWEGDWDGAVGLAAGESALKEATSDLVQAASGESATGIREVQSEAGAATESAENARALMGAFETARQELVKQLQQVRAAAEKLAEQAKPVVDAMWDASEHADVGSDNAWDIAEKLRNAVS